jgi:hypothetical protein
MASNTFTTKVQYCFRNGASLQYVVLNEAVIQTEGQVYAQLTNHPNMYTVDARRIIEQLPNNFINGIASYNKCICGVRDFNNPEFRLRPFVNIGVSTFFLPFQAVYTTYAIILSDQTQS